MAIIYIPFDELFAPEYQLTYISINGYINVGPHTYNIFVNYTMVERQQIFQVCEKHLPWKYTQEQEQWERTQYMYQFIIKSPPPFPYSEYPLSEDIIMADIILNVTVPDAWITRVLNAFNKITDIHMVIEARDHLPTLLNEFDGRWDFRIEDKQPTENNKQFGERVLRELGKAVVHMVDKAEDKIRYRTEVAAIIPPASDVPEDILT